MEGYLAKVSFYANLSGKHFANMEDCLAALKDNVTQEKDALSADKIIDAVCKFYHVTRSELVGKKRNKELVEPRQMCAYLMTELMSIPLVTIGQALGGKDHATIIHSRDKIAELIKINDRIERDIKDLKNLIMKK